ncbi:hypothetical protein BUE80_DR004411 [Diplocarpon rosae]|nr:hypothetical protein BUE80_DR004411 [Diplocarpon rosae]
MSATEVLQIASVLADLQTLQNAVRPLFPSSSPPTLSPGGANAGSHTSCSSAAPPPYTVASRVMNFFRRPAAEKLATKSDTFTSQEPAAALALLTPLKPASTNTTPSQSRPVKFDKLGRKIVTVPRLSREGSKDIESGSGTATGLPEYAAQTDPDLNRAETLLSLFEMRGKFKAMGDTGLTRAKERVDAVVARYAKADKEEREEISRARNLRI